MKRIKKHQSLVLALISLLVCTLWIAGITTNVFAKEGNEKVEHEKSISGIIKSAPEREKTIRKEFYKAERKIENNQKIDRNIERINSEIADYNKKSVSYKGKSEVIGGYFSAVSDLKEANADIKDNKQVDERIWEDIDYNLKLNKRKIYTSIVTSEAE